MTSRQRSLMRPILNDMTCCQATGLLGELLSSDAALASTWARKEQDGEEERGGGEDGEHGGEGDNSSP